MQDQVTNDLPFSFVPHWVTDSDISDRALRLYAVLAKFADSKTGEAWPGRTRLSKELGCSLKSVDRAVQELEAIHALKKRRRVKDGHYQSSLYTVIRVNPATHETLPRVTGDATPRQDGRDPVSAVTHRTITTELEPENKNHLTRQTKMTADDYTPTNEFLEKLATEYPGVRLEVELEKFRDHHMANGSSFKIWDRAFRKWVRQASDWSPEARAARVRAEEEAKFEQWKRENGEY